MAGGTRNRQHWDRKLRGKKDGLLLLCCCWYQREPDVAGNITWLCFPEEVSALSVWELLLLQGSLQWQQLGFPAEAGSTDTFHLFLSAPPA